MPGALTTIVGILAQYAMQAVNPTTPAPDTASEPTRGGAGGATDGAGPSTSAPAAGAGVAGGEGRSAGGSVGGGAGAVGVDRLSRSASLEDCVIKMLRLVANLAIHPEASDAPQESSKTVFRCKFFKTWLSRRGLRGVTALQTLRDLTQTLHRACAAPLLAHLCSHLVRSSKGMQIGSAAAIKRPTSSYAQAFSFRPLKHTTPHVLFVHPRLVPCSRSSSRWWTACCTFWAATSTRILRSWC